MFPWFPWFFGSSLAVAALAMLVFQSQFKWALLRRIGRWPSVQSMLVAVARLWAWRVLRRLPTTQVSVGRSRRRIHRPATRAVGRPRWIGSGAGTIAGRMAGRGAVMTVDPAGVSGDAGG